jgi:DNA-binding response OmpR family regulator
MSTPINIVVVEDHSSLQELLVARLCHHGYSATGVASAEELDDLWMRSKVDVLVLDINLPGEDGVSIAARLSQVNPMLRIIMLTAKSAEKDKLLGYESGADIYLTKPASPSELLAAVRSIERRIMQAVPSFDLVLDCLKMQLIANASSRLIHLSDNELALLKGLSAAPNHKLDYWRLLDLLGKPVDEKSKAALSVKIHRLKLKVMTLGVDGPVIKSNFNEGYQLAVNIQVIL